MDREPEQTSYSRTRSRFDTTQAANKYAHRRSDGRCLQESRCILSALTGVQPGSRVLDLPCGTGRLIPMLVDAGFLVTAADASLHMIKHSKHAWEMACREQPERRDKAEFVAQDIMRTTFAAGSFDAVVCNRLFHHYREPALRRAALAELRRISSGPLVVFYFDRFALDTIRLAGLRAIFGKFVNDRFPIPGKRFAAEAATVGLRLEKVIWKRWGISPQAYAVFRLSGDCRNATTTDIAAHRWPHILT